MPRTARSRQFVDWNIGEKYRICKRIESGSYGSAFTVYFLVFFLTYHKGEIYSGYNIHTGEDVAIKLESRFSGYSHLQNEYKMYQSLGTQIGIPHCKWFGTERDYSIMTMTLLGASLENLFNTSGSRFSLEVVLGIAEQMVRHMYLLAMRAIFQF